MIQIIKNTQKDNEIRTRNTRIVTTKQEIIIARFI